MHSNVVGGSSASRVMNCGPSTALINSLPREDTSSAASRQGTMLHAAIEKCLNEEMLPEDLLDEKFTLEGVPLTRDLIASHLTPALRAFDQLNKEVGDISFELEQKCEFPGIPNAFGTVDVVGGAHGDTTAVIVDWKFGYVNVELQREDQQLNEQAMFYACAARNSIPWLANAKQFVLAIIQPANANPLTHVTVTHDELDAFEVNLRHAVENPKPDANPGPWCKFQICQQVCPHKLQQANELANLLDYTPAEVDEIGEGTFVEVLELADSVEAWCKEIKAFALTKLNNGQPVEGWKLTQGYGHAKWIPEQESKLLSRLRAKKYLKRQFTKEQLLTPAQMKKLAPEIKYEDLTVRPLSTPRIVRESQPGEDLNLKKEQFNELTADAK